MILLAVGVGLILFHALVKPVPAGIAAGVILIALAADGYF